MLTGPLFFRWLQGHAPLDKGFARGILDRVIPAFSATLIKLRHIRSLISTEQRAISAKQASSRIVGKQELIQKCPCEKSDDIEQVGSSEANLIWVSNDKSIGNEKRRSVRLSGTSSMRFGDTGRLPGTNLPSTSDMAIWHKPRMDRCGSPDYIEDPPIRGGTPLPQSSRSRIRGLTESARSAGIQVASRPSAAIARTTPTNTTGSRGVAW